MRPSVKLISETVMHCLQFLMAMEVTDSLFLGMEVSKYVEKIFIAQLKNSKMYKEGKFGDALVETFRRVDDLIQSKEGEEELKLIRKKNEGSNMGANRIC